MFLAIVVVSSSMNRWISVDSPWASRVTLPSGSLRRYVEVMAGLVLLVTVLQPLLGWLGADLAAAAAAAQARLERELAATADSQAAAAAAAAGTDWHQAALREAFAARVADTVRQGRAQSLGIDSRVEVILGAGPPGSGAGAGPPPLERVVVRLQPGSAAPGAAGGAAPGAAASPAVQIPPVRIGSSPAAPGDDRAAAAPGRQGPGPDPALAARISAWVADALAIEASRVTVIAAEEVEW